MNTFGLGRPVNSFWLGKPKSVLLDAWRNVVKFKVYIAKITKFRVE